MCDGQKHWDETADALAQASEATTCTWCSEPFVPTYRGQHMCPDCLNRE